MWSEWSAYNSLKPEPGGGLNLPPAKKMKGEMKMKKEKKSYQKPEIKKNKHLVNVTFLSGPSVPGTPGSPGSVV